MTDFIHIALKKSEEVGFIRGLLLAEKLISKSSNMTLARISLLDAIEGKLNDSSLSAGSLDPGYSGESKNPCGKDQDSSGQPQGNFRKDL